MEEIESLETGAAGRRSVLRRETHARWREFVVEAETLPDGALRISVTGRDANGAVATRLDGVVARTDLHALAHVLGPELKAVAAWLRVPQDSFDEVVSRARRVHEKAYTPWTAEEERRLLAQFRAGLSVPELSQALGRSTGAVFGRLVQLGEVDPIHSASA